MLKRNIFTEKLFEAIEAPWSNESTPSSTPAKQTQQFRSHDPVFLNAQTEESRGASIDGMHNILRSAVECLDDEPDFIVWKLAEKMFLRQVRNVAANVFAAWFSEINRATKSKRMSQKSRIMHRRKLQLKMFNSWYGSVLLISRSGKKKLDVANFLKSKTKKCMMNFFVNFKVATLSTHANSAINRRSYLRLLRSCTDKWRKHSTARAKNYTKSLKMAYKVCLRSTFRSWIFLTKSNRRLESLLHVFQRRMIRKNVNMYFKRWYYIKLSSSSNPSKNTWLAHHLDALERKHSIAAIKAWSRISARRRQVRSVFLNTLCRKMLAGKLTYESWCKQSAMMNWKEKTRKKNISSCPTSAKHARSSKQFLISTIFSSWSRHCVVDRRIKCTALRHNHMKKMNSFKKCFHIWKMVAKSFGMAKLKSNHMFKYRNYNRKTRSFIIWRHVLAASTNNSIISADSFRLQILKRKHLLLWNRWKQRALHRVKLQRAYKSRARLRLSTMFALRNLFWEWKMGILSEQFFANYVMKRFLGLWRQLLNLHSECISPSETKTPIGFMMTKPLILNLACETRHSSMAEIYRRKVLRLTFHGWAWTCSERLALLEKLQIAYMIRSSIRTCTKYFAAWLNETLKISQTSVCPKPVPPLLDQPLHEPMDAKQRTFEILNIALVERILLCHTSKRLLRKSFRSWLYTTQSSSAIHAASRLRVMAFSFSKWAEISLDRIAECDLKRVRLVFKCWKWLTCQNSAFREIVVKFEDRRIVRSKSQGMDAWCSFTFGSATATRKKKNSYSENQIVFKNQYFAFRAWNGWTKTSLRRLQDLEAAAQSKFIDGMSKYHFNAWMALHISRRRSEKMAMANKRRSICLVFRGWSRCTFVKKKANKLIVSLQHYQATSMLVLCWNAWRGGLEQRNYRTLTLSVTVKLIQKCNAVSVPVRIAWNAWRNFISTRRFVRSAKEKITRQVCDKMKFRNIFKRWRTASRRRRNISIALAKPCTMLLRQIFFAFKYNIVRSVFFARQFKRISQKFHRRSCDSQGQDFLKSNPVHASQESQKGDSQPEVMILEEKVLKLQSEKIQLMEQLKCALQGQNKELHSPTFSQASEMQQRHQETVSRDQMKIPRTGQHNQNETSSCQHPLFPVQSRGQYSTSTGMSGAPASAPVQHHLACQTLPHNERQTKGSICHQDSKVSSNEL
jgi:hypothetical protein